MGRIIKLVLPLVLVGGVLMYMLSSPANKSLKPAPEFSGQLMDGSEFSLSDLRGDYVLLDFWGSWCPPCRKENPKLAALYNKYGGQDFEIVSVALEKNDKGWQKAIKKDQLNWPYHILRTSRLVAADPLALRYQVSDLPTKFLIDPKGKIISVNPSFEEIMTTLDGRG